MSPFLAREMLTLSLQHLWLVVIAITVAAAVAIPGGVLLTRRPGLRRSLLGFASVIETVPSLALFGFLLPLPFLGGIGPHTAITALCLYALLPIVRNTVVGITGVDPAVREAAVAMRNTWPGLGTSSSFIPGTRWARNTIRISCSMSRSSLMPASRW